MIQPEHHNLAIWLLWVVAIYYAPTLVCLLRFSLVRFIKVFVVNTLAGWTLLGWLWAWTLV